MSGRVRARGRIALTAADVNEYGAPSTHAHLEIVGALLDTPAMCELEIDLGPVRQVDHQLVEALADAVRDCGVYVTVTGAPIVARGYERAVDRMSRRVTA